MNDIGKFINLQWLIWWYVKLYQKKLIWSVSVNFQMCNRFFFSPYEIFFLHLPRNLKYASEKEKVIITLILIFGKKSQLKMTAHFDLDGTGNAVCTTFFFFDIRYISLSLFVTLYFFFLMRRRWEMITSIMVFCCFF